MYLMDHYLNLGYNFVNLQECQKSRLELINKTIREGDTQYIHDISFIMKGKDSIL